MVTQYNDYYVENVYALSDAIEGVGGYLLLIAMVLTSFKFGRNRLSARQWKFLHRFGIYWLWIYAWIAYWWHLFYYNEPIVLDYVYYWTGFLAWGLRMAAWTKKRWPQATGPSTTEGTRKLLYLLPGVAAVATGLVGTPSRALARSEASTASFSALVSPRRRSHSASESTRIRRAAAEAALAQVHRRGKRGRSLRVGAGRAPGQGFARSARAATVRA